MGSPSLPEAAVLFTGLLYRNEEDACRAREVLEGRFGSIALPGAPMRWDYSDYYSEEMGSPLIRQFLFFGQGFDPADMPAAKLFTNTLEAELSRNSKRSVNIDPGYLTLSKVVLASTKDYAHRIYLGRGIFGEVTLVFRRGRYEPHLFTYRDYADEAFRALFLRARELLRGHS